MIAACAGMCIAFHSRSAWEPGNKGLRASRVRRGESHALDRFGARASEKATDGGCAATVTSRLTPSAAPWSHDRGGALLVSVANQEHRPLTSAHRIAKSK